MYQTYFLDSAPSTNIVAKKLADNGALHGTAVIAANQTEGRGRLGKNWCSVAGKGLYCSIIVRPELAVENYAKITLVAGLAVAFVLDRMTGLCSQLKWPNDIYFSGKKIGGILTESSALNCSSMARYAVVGIGINANHCIADFPVELREIVTSITIETGDKIAVNDLFLEIRQELLHQLQLFSADGFEPLLCQWRKKDFLLGKEMECVNTEGKRIRGIAKGPDEEGQLHVQDASGRTHEVLSGDVRLATS